MLNQKAFGEKLRKHRKSIGMTQEEVATQVGVSAQAISKWEAGECLPDCLNLKIISDVYNLSADVLLETDATGDIDAVSNKIKQLGNEYVWARLNENRYNGDFHQELGDDLLKMWKGLYFSEIGNSRARTESKKQGNLRISGSYGMKIWDDEGIVCVVKNALIKNLDLLHMERENILMTLCTPDCIRLFSVLDCTVPIAKEDIINKTNIDINRLNELLLLLTENKIIEFVADNRISNIIGYKISGHCGIVAYMILSAIYILNKEQYNVSEHLLNHDNNKIV